MVGTLKSGGGLWYVGVYINMVVFFQNRGPNIDPQNAMVLILGTPKKCTRKFGKPAYQVRVL